MLSGAGAGAGAGNRREEFKRRLSELQYLIKGIKEEINGGKTSLQFQGDLSHTLSNAQTSKQNSNTASRVYADSEQADISAENKKGYAELMRAELMRAVNFGDTGYIRLLLDNPDIDVNGADEFGNTPLMSAANSGNVECVKVLCNTSGIDVNKENKFGYTALMLAVMNGHFECVEMLCKVKHINVDGVDDLGNTALMLARKKAEGSSPMSAHFKRIEALINHRKAAISEDNEISQQYLEPEEVMMDDSESRLADEAKRAARKRSYERTRVDEK